jgi:hypothetical protein
MCGWFFICCLNAAILALGAWFLILYSDAWAWIGIALIVSGFFGQMNYSSWRSTFVPNPDDPCG